MASFYNVLVQDETMEFERNHAQIHCFEQDSKEQKILWHEKFPSRIRILKGECFKFLRLCHCCIVLLHHLLTFIRSFIAIWHVETWIKRFLSVEWGNIFNQLDCFQQFKMGNLRRGIARATLLWVIWVIWGLWSPNWTRQAKK